MFTPELSLLFPLAASLLSLPTSPPSSNSQTSLNRLTLIFLLLLSLCLVLPVAVPGQEDL